MNLTEYRKWYNLTIHQSSTFASFSWVVCSCWDHKAPHQAHDVRLSKSNCHGGLLAFRNSLDLYGVRKQNVYLLFGRRPDINQIIIPPPPPGDDVMQPIRCRVAIIPGITACRHQTRFRQKHRPHSSQAPPRRLARGAPRHVPAPHLWHP